MEKQPTNYFLYFAAFSISFIIFGSGTSYAWTSPFLPKFESNDSSINPISRPATATETGLLVSIINLGLLIGPIIPVLLTEKLGKKTTLLLSSLPLAVAHIFCSLAKTIEVFLIARFLMGLAIGAVWAVVPVYIAEISEPRNRGFLSSLTVIMTSTGSLFGFCTGPFLSMKWFSIVNLFPFAIFFILTMFFIPESPNDLIKKKDFAKAERSLIKLRKVSNVHDELSVIKKSIEAENVTNRNFFDLFTDRSLTRAMIIGVGINMILPLSGVWAIVGYTQTIFDLAGSSIPSAYSAIAVAFISLFASIIHTTLIDRLGRKILIIASCGTVFLSLSTLGIFFYLQESNFNVDSLAWLPLCSLILFMTGYYLGLGSIPYIMLGELFPSNIKSVAAGFCTSINFTLTFITTLCFPYLINSIGIAFTFWLFAIFVGFGLIFCLTVVPETNGKSLQEITAMLNNSRKN